MLERYDRMIQKRPLHTRLNAVQNASREKVMRCVSDEAPDELAKLYAPASSPKMLEQMTDFEAGRVNYFLEETEEAFLSLRKAFEKGDPKAAALLGKIMLKTRNDARGALPVLEEALESGNETAAGLAGEACERKNDNLKAIDFYSREIENGIFDHYINLGQLYEYTGQTQKAIEVYEKAFRAEKPEAVGFLMRLFEDRGDMKKSMRKFMGSLSFGERPNVYFMQGYFFYQAAKLNGEKKKMLKGMERMMDIVLLHRTDLWILLCEVFLQEKMIPQARRLCELAINQKKKAYNKLAAIYFMTGEIDKAEEVSRNGIENKDTLCHFYLGAIGEKKGDMKDAIKHFQNAAESKDERAYLKLGIIYEKLGKSAEAGKNYEFAMHTRDKKKTEGRYLIFLLRNNDFARAEHVLKEVLKGNINDDSLVEILPKDKSAEVQKLCMAAAAKNIPRAHLIMAKYFIAINDVDGAEAHLRIAAKQGLREARPLLAKIFEDAGKFAHAREEYREALKEKTDCYMAFANCLDKSGYDEEAAFIYRMAIDMGHEEAYEKLIPLLVGMNKFQEAQILLELAHRKDIKLKGLFSHFEKNGKTGINTDQKEIPRDELN